VRYKASESPVGTATILEPTTLSLEPLTVIADKGTSTTFTGKLVDSNGKGVAGKTIHLYINGQDTGATAITDENGSYTLTYNWTSPGNYTFQTKYLGD
jgi:protocatechuate 3,4-dioxygenase beta subunit